VFQARSMTQRLNARGARRPRRIALLLVQILVLATVAACGGETTTVPPDDRPPAAPEPLTPRGATTLPAAFTWKAVPGNPIYRVIVTDEAERELHHQDVRNATTSAIPEELTTMMAERHATFSWSVAIVTPDGRRLAQSAPVQFWLK
jgi:hypothetical protein